jgi:predicted aspartyl protease
VNLLITIDTGFGGEIALPKEVLRKMKVILISYGVFKLATGDEIELPIFLVKISIQLIEKMKENLKLFRIFLFVSRQ